MKKVPDEGKRTEGIKKIITLISRVLDPNCKISNIEERKRT